MARVMGRVCMVDSLAWERIRVRDSFLSSHSHQLMETNQLKHYCKHFIITEEMHSEDVCIFVYLNLGLFTKSLGEGGIIIFFS